MIYLDAAATSLLKPPAVAESAAWALTHLGNAGRGAYHAATEASRAVYGARRQVARLCGLGDPLRVAFTSGTTESLNLLIGGLLGPDDHVITTVLEHNSVLRPLYAAGCGLSFIDCDDVGVLQLDALPGLLKPNTRAVVCTHGSNLLGCVTDLDLLSRFCKENGLLFILDAAQTMGCLPVPADAADFTCFCGHKALMGPQGTGGVLAGPAATVRVFKTGGTGSNSFDAHQPTAMPDMLEAGTPNAQGLYLLGRAVEALNEMGLDAVAEAEKRLTARLLGGLAELPGVTLYGPPAAAHPLPVVALNVGGLDSEEVCLRLWEEYAIAARPGSHCAPLAHRRFGTGDTGMVRLSYGPYNTEAEMDAAVAAIATIAGAGGGR